MQDRLGWFTKSMGSEEAGKTGVANSLMKSVCRGKQKNRVVATGRWGAGRPSLLKMPDSTARLPAYGNGPADRQQAMAQREDNRGREALKNMGGHTVSTQRSQDLHPEGQSPSSFQCTTSPRCLVPKKDPIIYLSLTDRNQS